MTVKSKAKAEPKQQEKNNNTNIITEAIKIGDIETVKKILFFKKFARFQSELPTIKKSEKVVTHEGSYYYAPLDKIISIVRPLLLKHGLTYRFDFSESNGDEITCSCIITDFETGFEIKSSMKSVKDKSLQNELQSAGSTMTYLMRYTFVAVTGIIADTDDDGRSFIAPTPSETIPKPKIIDKKAEQDKNEEFLFKEEA